jgi:alpha-1,3-glucosyltransferase
LTRQDGIGTPRSTVRTSRRAVAAAAAARRRMLAAILASPRRSPNGDDDASSSSSSSSIPRGVLPLVLGVALLIRVATSTHPHSGESAPPLYGDYEAQRHWMEITTSLPLREWYVHAPGKGNDMMYWGLDYPPLTAYQARSI